MAGSLIDTKITELHSNNLLPRIVPGNKKFWDGLKEKKFLTTKCKGCGELTFPPKAICPSCFSDELRWTELSGRGELIGSANMRIVPRPFINEAPYAVGIVRLEEGPTLLSRIKTSFEELETGMKVEVVFEPLADDIQVFAFKPV